jgi:hypothetical protein
MPGLTVSFLAVFYREYNTGAGFAIAVVVAVVVDTDEETESAHSRVPSEVRDARS